MATLFSSSSLHSIRLSSTLSSVSSSSSSSSSSLAFCNFPFRPLTPSYTITNRRFCVAKAVEEEQTQQVEEEAPQQQQQDEITVDSEQQQPVVVPVSPSDTLTMFFQAEGTLNETAIPTLTKALEETEGVTDLKVNLVEGLATLELKKQTTVQATGVASGLVETIQGSGFKLQTLNLSFDEEEVAVV